MALITVEITPGAPAHSTLAFIAWLNVAGDLSALASPSGGTRTLSSLSMVRADGVASFQVDLVGDEQELTPAWENSNPAIIIRVPGISDLEIAGPSAPGANPSDSTETYNWGLNDAASVAWLAAFAALSETDKAAATFTFQELIPPVRLSVAFTGSGLGESELSVGVRIAVAFTGSGLGESQPLITNAGRIAVAFTGSGLGSSELGVVQPPAVRLSVAFEALGFGASTLSVVQPLSAPTGLAGVPGTIGSVDWAAVRFIEVSQRDAAGRDRRIYFDNPDFKETGKVVAFRRDDDDGTRNVVGYRTDGIVTRLSGNQSWRLPVQRYSELDEGEASAIAPPTAIDYQVRFLLPFITLGVATFFSRTIGTFHKEISLALAQQLEGSTSPWPQAAAAIAEDITPGPSKIGDIVILFNGSISEARTWNGTDWIRFELVGESLLVTGGVTTPKLAAGAITADKILAGTITSDRIASRTIVADRIAAGVVPGSLSDLAGQIGASAIEDAAIIADKIAAGVITAAKIAALTITADKIAAGVITAAKIAALTITADKIAAGVITADKIAALAITAAKIDALAVTAAKIAAGAVTADKIDALAVTAAKIAAGTITADKMAVGVIPDISSLDIPEQFSDLTGTIGSADIATGAIISGKIAAGAIVAAKLFVGSVTADKIIANAITTVKINGNAVTEAKLDSAVTEKLNNPPGVPSVWADEIRFTDTGTLVTINVSSNQQSGGGGLSSTEYAWINLQANAVSGTGGVALDVRYDRLRIRLYDSASCFLLDTPVAMADGSIRQIGDVKIGDFLWSPHGPREVVALDGGMVAQYAQIVVDLPDGATKFSCSLNHPIWTGTRFCAVCPNPQGDARRFRPVAVRDGDPAVWRRGNRGHMGLLGKGSPVALRDGGVGRVIDIAIEEVEVETITPVTGSWLAVASGVVASAGYDYRTYDMADTEAVRRFFTEGVEQ